MRWESSFEMLIKCLIKCLKGREYTWNTMNRGICWRNWSLSSQYITNNLKDHLNNNHMSGFSPWSSWPLKRVDISFCVNSVQYSPSDIQLPLPPKRCSASIASWAEFCLHHRPRDVAEVASWRWWVWTEIYWRNLTLHFVFLPPLRAFISVYHSGFWLYLLSLMLEDLLLGCDFVSLAKSKLLLPPSEAATSF